MVIHADLKSGEASPESKINETGIHNSIIKPITNNRTPTTFDMG